MYPAYRRGLEKELIVDIDRVQKGVYHTYKDVEIHENHISKAESYSESYETFQHPAFDNPYYNVDDYNAEVKELFEGRVDEAVFKERNFGTFESLSGNFFMGIDEERVFVKSHPLPENVTCYRTIDPGRAGKACCLWVAVQPWEDNKFRYIVYRELYMEGLYVEKFVDIVKRMTSEDILYTVCDRQATQRRFDSKDTVAVRMEELGIRPLRTPVHGMLPHTSLERFNYWLPDIKDGRVVIFEDQCPNFQREIQELEYAQPDITKTGHMVRQEKLANSDQNALDAFTYLRYFNPKYISDTELEQSAIKAEEKRSKIVHPMSFASVLGERRARRKMGILSLMRE
jgi:hypothetical protein